MQNIRQLFFVKTQKFQQSFQLDCFALFSHLFQQRQRIIPLSVTRLLAVKSRQNLRFLAAGLLVTASAAPWSSKDERAEKRKLPIKSPKDEQVLKELKKRDGALHQDILLADEYYETGDRWRYVEIYQLLIKHVEKDEPEMLWRLARACYDRSRRESNKTKRNEDIEEGFALIKRALATPNGQERSPVHKWVAILLNEAAGLKGTKEQITQLENVRFHMEKAIEFNPNDPTSVYLLGHWCFSVASVPYYQKKIAEVVFAKPPTCQFTQALESFLQAERIQPGFYSMNWLLIAKSYLQLGEYMKAEEYLEKVLENKVANEDDRLANEEAQGLIGSTRKKADQERAKQKQAL